MRFASTLSIPDYVLNFDLVDSAVAKQLIDKIYEKRKAAALELEKCVHSLSNVN